MSPRARPVHFCVWSMDGWVGVAGFELVWAFMQFNSVRALSNSHDVASFLLPTGGGGGAAGDWGPEPDGLDQAATALALYSDIDVLMACRCLTA